MRSEAVASQRLIFKAIGKGPTNGMRVINKRARFVKIDAQCAVFGNINVIKEMSMRIFPN